MKHILQTSIALATAALLLSSTGSQAQTAYALTGNGTSLIKFNLATPGVTSLVGNFSGAATSLAGIDFRSADGLLYGYSTTGNTLVTINLATAATTATPFPPSIGTTTSNFGIDFNPAADRLRVVNVDDQNLRINIGTGVTIADTPLAYIAADPNVGVNPFINEAAYTNNDNNPNTGTSLFYLDYNLDTLVKTANPNGGALETVGALGVNTSDMTGFDIFTDISGGNTGYAILTSGGSPSLYTVNLLTGAATSLGAVGATRPFSLAIAQPVPEPGTICFGLGLIGVCLSRRARRA